MVLCFVFLGFQGSGFSGFGFFRVPGFGVGAWGFFRVRGFGFGALGFFGLEGSGMGLCLFVRVPGFRNSGEALGPDLNQTPPKLLYCLRARLLDGCSAFGGSAFGKWDAAVCSRGAQNQEGELDHHHSPTLHSIHPGKDRIARIGRTMDPVHRVFLGASERKQLTEAANSLCFPL